MTKKIFCLILAVLIIAAAGWYFFTGDKRQADLENLKEQYPKLTVYVDDVINKQESLKENENEIERYTSLGLAWKSLADWARSEGVGNYNDYYREALKVYEAGIDKSLRRNTLLMINAGNIAKYLVDYRLTENYYKEAISVSPGDETYYALLAELYEYEMKKPKEEVLAVYDEGLKRVLNVGWLTARKEAYLERLEPSN
jgi:tetratricopeptide (TPR) repeat protein